MGNIAVLQHGVFCRAKVNAAIGSDLEAPQRHSDYHRAVQVIRRKKQKIMKLFAIIFVTTSAGKSARDELE